MSLSEGKFPDSLKIAKVVPIFKQGSHLSCNNNYLPISVLPALSKIFEKCVHNQLLFHFFLYDLIVPNKYGFRPGSHTSDCLVDLIKEITTSIDQGEFATTIFLDLTKAFDNVNHAILLSQLASYGINNLEHVWFKSYLQCRRQRVYVNGIFSDMETITISVPQGSILGHSFF